eukprot:gb/GEZN01001145.1/.p1 GENE.gb/GEZN01001145.1/~~gb/GEZN01001145.1/.p1  ORF type:complete len:1013 (+),score=165.33 gb/GEZN01001145.1/:79-3117(+)
MHLTSTELSALLRELQCRTMMPECNIQLELLVFSVMYSLLLAICTVQGLRALLLASSMSVIRARKKGVRSVLTMHATMGALALIRLLTTLRYTKSLYDVIAYRPSVFLVTVPYILEFWIFATLITQWAGVIKFPMDHDKRELLHRWKLIVLLVLLAVIGWASGALLSGVLKHAEMAVLSISIVMWLVCLVTGCAFGYFAVAMAEQIQKAQLASAAASSVKASPRMLRPGAGPSDVIRRGISAVGQISSESDLASRIKVVGLSVMSAFIIKCLLWIMAAFFVYDQDYHDDTALLMVYYGSDLWALFSILALYVRTITNYRQRSPSVTVAMRLSSGEDSVHRARSNSRSSMRMELRLASVRVSSQIHSQFTPSSMPGEVMDIPDQNRSPRTPHAVSSRSFRHGSHGTTPSQNTPVSSGHFNFTPPHNAMRIDTDGSQPTPMGQLKFGFKQDISLIEVEHGAIKDTLGLPEDTTPKESSSSSSSGTTTPAYLNDSSHPRNEDTGTHSPVYVSGTHSPVYINDNSQRRTNGTQQYSGTHSAIDLVDSSHARNNKGPLHASSRELMEVGEKIKQVNGRLDSSIHVEYTFEGKSSIYAEPESDLGEISPLSAPVMIDPPFPLQRQAAAVATAVTDNITDHGVSVDSSTSSNVDSVAALRPYSYPFLEQSGSLNHSPKISPANSISSSPSFPSSAAFSSSGSLSVPPIVLPSPSSSSYSSSSSSFLSSSSSSSSSWSSSSSSPPPSCSSSSPSPLFLNSSESPRPSDRDDLPASLPSEQDIPSHSIKSTPALPHTAPSPSIVAYSNSLPFLPKFGSPSGSVNLTQSEHTVMKSTTHNAIVYPPSSIRQKSDIAYAGSDAPHSDSDDEHEFLEIDPANLIPRKTKNSSPLLQTTTITSNPLGRSTARQVGPTSLQRAITIDILPSSLCTVSIPPSAPVRTDSTSTSSPVPRVRSLLNRKAQGGRISLSPIGTVGPVEKGPWSRISENGSPDDNPVNLSGTQRSMPISRRGFGNIAGSSSR